MRREGSKGRHASRPGQRERRAQAGQSTSDVRRTRGGWSVGVGGGALAAALVIAGAFLLLRRGTPPRRAVEKKPAAPASAEQRARAPEPPSAPAAARSQVEKGEAAIAEGEAPGKATLAAPEVAREAAPEVTPEVAPEVAREAAPEAAPEAAREAAPEAEAPVPAAAPVVRPAGAPKAALSSFTPPGVELAVPPEAPARKAPAGDVMTFDAPELAGISSLREMWDRPVVLSADGAKRSISKHVFGEAESAIWNEGSPGAVAFDAVHRSLLVRFPGSAGRIARRLAAGARIDRAEIVLPFVGTELWPVGYLEPAGLSFLGDTWKDWQPRWHAIAWGLRRPWRADPRIGPTCNASVNGAVYWRRPAAQDVSEDRFPRTFGPAEVSAKSPEGRLDVTAALTDAAFGPSMGQRLRAFEDNGLLVRKWEFYDAATWWGGYEWSTATGPRGILVGTPRLEVTFAPGRSVEVDLPRAADVEALARGGRRGEPTALMPTPEEFGSFKAKYGFQRPGWMPPWQWQHVKQLKALGGGKGFPETYGEYVKWIDDVLGAAPRRWAGFDASARAQEYLLYGDVWPEPARDSVRLYWWAWLMPDRDISKLVQGCIGGKEAQEYYARTRDWRGNFSVYRTYCYEMGTMNFNHWASAGTLFGGAIIGSERCVADGRHGLEHWPLRTWCWFDGSTQESIDHYYFAISLAAQKAFADFGPTHLDRMMGRSILAKSVDELTGAFHPELRRLISSSGRTGVAYLLCIQDGLQHILHTISRRGALTDAGREEICGMPVIGHDYLPGQVALQTVTAPWAPEWATAMLDEKPLPYEMTTSYKRWGGFSATPLWRRTYLGRHYGLASQDVVHNDTVPVMAQWRRSPRQVESMRELGTLIARYGINRTELLDSVYHGTDRQNPNGVVGVQGGPTFTVQHRNRAVVLASPVENLDAGGGRPVPSKVTSLQTTIGIMNYEDTPSWSIYVNGRKVTRLPCQAKFGSVITLHDGVSYVALVPIPATDLGRDAEVVISADAVETPMQGGGKTKEALRIDAYNLKLAAPRERSAVVGRKTDLAYGGFVVEMGDESEYGSFSKFQRHMKRAKLGMRWDAAAETLHLAYASGNDKIEVGFRPGYRDGPTDKAFPYRRVNGKWPYLPADMDRDSTLTQQGRSGRLEKNGAVLVSEKGKMAYLQTEPASGTYVGYNPFPDATVWSLEVPGGVRVKADGRIGIARVAVRPGENWLRVDHAFRKEQEGRAGMATALVAFGLKRDPVVELNGRRLTDVRAVVVEGKKAHVVPLVELSRDAARDRRSGSPGRVRSSRR